MATNELVARSVTRDEQAEAGTGILRFHSIGYSSNIQLPPTPPVWWTKERDVVLKAAYRADGLFGSAVNIAATRVASHGYDLDGEVGLRTRTARKMLGRDWVRMVQKIARDYCTQDNGAFIEIVRATKSYGSKVIGFVYLDSARCYRTGDPERPVIYEDRLGQLHELRSYQVADFSDLPEDEFFGVGMCATSRAYRAIYLHIAAETYLSEKITGARAQALDIVTGISSQKIEGALGDAKARSETLGYTQYMGAAILSNPNEVPISHTRIPFVDLPDKFDPATFEEDTEIKYSAALGIDPNELNPKLIGNRALGAGSQAATLDDKQNAKGLIALRLQIRDFFNDTERWHPLPGATTFAWSERDLTDQKAQAEVSKLRADTRKVQIDSKEITPDIALRMAVNAGDVPEEFAPTATDASESYSDQDKPENSADAAEVAPGVDTAPGTDQPAAVVAPAVKSLTLKEHTSAVVALALPRSAAQRLRAQWDATGAATDAATPVDEMHCTLVYLGKAADLDPIKGEIIAAIESVARGFAPLVGNVNGFGAFAPSESSDELVPIYKSLDCVQLPALRHALYESCKAAGWQFSGEAHGFVPHITLDYLEIGTPIPPIDLDGFPVVFPSLAVMWAGEQIEIPLGGNAAALKQWADVLASIKRMPAGATILASFEPPAEAPRDAKSEASYWREVTKQFDEIGSAWTAAAEPPQAAGETMRSIAYTIKNRNTHLVRLELHAGNKERPEVAIRAVLFGRKGFGPKRAKVLRFRVGSKTVYARKVRGAAANDWFSRSIERIKPQIRAAEKQLGKFASSTIDVADIAGARRYNVAPAAPSDRKIAADRRAWQKANPGKGRSKTKEAAEVQS